MTRITVELSLLTFVRSSELRFAPGMSSILKEPYGGYLHNAKR